MRTVVIARAEDFPGKMRVQLLNSTSQIHLHPQATPFKDYSWEATLMRPITLGVVVRSRLELLRRVRGPQDAPDAATRGLPHAHAALPPRGGRADRVCGASAAAGSDRDRHVGPQSDGPRRFRRLAH